MATDEWGIDEGWWGNDGHWHHAEAASVAAIRSAMDRHGTGRPPDAPPLWFVRSGTAPALWGAARLHLEDGAEVALEGSLPPDLPIGRHLLHPEDAGPTTTMFVTPGITPGLGRRRWGVAAQLYSARSDRSQGIGDFSDLATLGRWLAGRGGEVLGLNPLGAPLELAPRQNSPYSPSTRQFLDPIYLDVGELAPDGAAAPTGRAGADGLIDRDAVWAAKRAILEQAFAARAERGAVDAARHDHAVFCTLTEHHGCGWPGWPADLHDPAGPAVAEFAAAHVERVAFWGWVSALADEQYDAAASELTRLGITLIGDLTVGVDRAGFDTWIHADCFAPDMSIGAPPDIFNTAGQDWSLAPLDPWALRAAAYAPFIETLRASFHRYGGLRIDHVMGLFRLYWIPEGAGPDQGAYVRYPADEMLDLVALEASRAGGIVIGEDLGTVEDTVRENLAVRRIAGTRVGWFDPAPSSWPEQSVGTLTTHDLPTVVGALSGADPSADPRLAAGLLDTLGHDPSGDVGELLIEAHAHLGAAGSTIVLATLEDVVGSPERVNLPGAGHDHPSWRIPLPVSIDQLEDHPVARAVTDAVARNR